MSAVWRVRSAEQAEPVLWWLQTPALAWHLSPGLAPAACMTPVPAEPNDELWRKRSNNWYQPESLSAFQQSSLHNKLRRHSTCTQLWLHLLHLEGCVSKVTDWGGFYYIDIVWVTSAQILTPPLRLSDMMTHLTSWVTMRYEVTIAGPLHGWSWVVILAHQKPMKTLLCCHAVLISDKVH